MDPRRKSALLWGLIGALAFLVAHQGYLLVGGEFLGVGPIAAVAVVVFAATAIGAYYAEGRFGMALATTREPSKGDTE